MSRSVLRRVQGLFWDRSLTVRWPARRLKRALSVLAYRWRTWRGSGKPPRIVTNPASGRPGTRGAAGLPPRRPLARGIPCVATAVGEIPELLCDGGGVLVERPGDLDALAAGLESLLDGERRSAEGRRGRATVAERFSLESYRGRYERWIFSPNGMTSG